MHSANAVEKLKFAGMMQRQSRLPRHLCKGFASFGKIGKKFLVGIEIFSNGANGLHQILAQSE